MKKMGFIFILVIITLISSKAQIIVISDFVKIKNDNYKEAIFYYENNWKLFRDKMLEKGFIKSYKMYKVKPDSIANFDLILTTEYIDSTQFKLSEERFGKIIKTLRPNSSLFLNEKKPADFRQIVFNKQSEVLFDSDKRKSKK